MGTAAGDGVVPVRVYKGAARRKDAPVVMHLHGGAFTGGGPKAIGTALFTGLVNSFSNPSRDSLLSRVAGTQLTRAVAAAGASPRLSSMR